MSNHALGSPDGQRTCDALFDALRKLHPDVNRKSAKGTCAFAAPDRANIAYVYHRRTKRDLDIYFASQAHERFEPVGRAIPKLRAKLGSGWASRFAWRLEIDSAGDVEGIANFLLARPIHPRRSRRFERQIPQEVEEDGSYFEGATSQATVNRYERDAGARKACVKHHGAVCAACGFDFGRAYGPDFVGVITVHHLRPLSEIRANYKVDPKKDLLPLCPNCHLAVHRQTPPLSIQQLKHLLEAARSRPT